jgi:hypothetical protein
LLVAASLNGGNVLSAFVHMVHSWQSALDEPSALPVDRLWSRLIELALRSPSVSIEHFSAGLFGERHDPSMCASFVDIRPMQMSHFNQIGSVFRSICQWIVNNLFDMLGEHAATMTSIVATGSALMRNSLLQRLLSERIDGRLVLNEHCDAAHGAALFVLNT